MSVDPMPYSLAYINNLHNLARYTHFSSPSFPPWIPTSACTME
ncbi:hypothetical protein A2U01_0084199, partial [Trifolium medium]|nr:hypothetical protein [Trifolium medium]